MRKTTCLVRDFFFKFIGMFYDWLMEAKRLIGDHCCISGGFNDKLLIGGTTEQVKDKVNGCWISALPAVAIRVA